VPIIKRSNCITQHLVSSHSVGGRPVHRPAPYRCDIYIFTAIGLSPGGSGYFTCNQNMKLVTTEFKSGGLHEKHVVATWNLGNHLSICL